MPKAAAHGALPHPTPLLQPSLHACITPPTPSVPVKLDVGMVQQGILSAEQLELIARTLDAHNRIHEDETGRAIRLGSALVFGTGSGKTSIALGTIEATRNATTPKHPAVILTINNLIEKVFIEQCDELGMDPNAVHILKHANLETLQRINLNETPTLLVTLAIARRIIKVTTYEALAACTAHPDALWQPLLRELAQKQHEAREQYISVRFMDLLLRMLPGDTLWVWDECDGLRTKDSDQNKAYRQVDKAQPFARMVYLSATATPNAEAIGYLANRLGIAGKNALYQTAEQAVEAAKKDLTLAEIMVANAVGLGTLSTGGLSYEGIVYDTIVTQTTPEQRVLIDACNDALATVVAYGKQRVRRYDHLTFDEADFPVPTQGELTTLARLARSTAVMDLCRDALFAHIDQAIERGEQVIVELAHTGEAQRRDSVLNEETHVGTSGRQIIARLLRKAALPLRVRVIERDGKRILIDRTPELTERTRALFARMFDAVVEQDHILTALADRYGNRFDEITGRGVRTTRVGGQFQTTRRSPKRDNDRAKNHFNAGLIRVLAISEAGSRGIDLHAAGHFECTAQRHLMVFDPFLRPAEFAQALGRACRTGQISWPKVSFFSTDIPALSASLSSVVSKVRAAGACTYGDRRAIRVQTMTADLHSTRGKYAIDKALYDLRDTSPFKEIFAEWNAPTAFTASSTSFLLRAANLPCNDKHAHQQKLWSLLAKHYADSCINEPNDGVQHIGAEKIDIAPIKIAGVDALRLTSTQAGTNATFVRTWQQLQRQETNGGEHVYTVIKGNVHAYIPLPNFGQRLFKEYLHYTPLHSELHAGDPKGTTIDALEAKTRWEAEIANLPKSTRTAIVVPFPITNVVDLDRRATAWVKADLAEREAHLKPHLHTKVEPLITDETLTRNVNLFYDERGHAIFGLWLSSWMVETLEERAHAAGLVDDAGTMAA